MRKQLLMLSAGLIMGLTACEKQQQYQAEATITTFDMTLCACCGGYIIEIDGAGSYRFYEDNLPTNHQLDLTTLPIDVDLDWQAQATGCGNIIDISAIAEQ